MASQASYTSPCAIRGSYRTDDMVKFAVEAAPWQIVVKPLDGRPFHNEKDYLVTPNIILYRERFKSAIKVCGLTPENSFTFSLPLSRGNQLQYWNDEEIANRFPVSMPDAADAIFDDGQRHLMVIINLQFLKETFTEETYDNLVKISRSRWMPFAQERLCSLATRLVSILDETASYPAILSSNTAIETLELELAETLSHIVSSQNVSRYRPGMPQSRLGLRKSLALLLDEKTSHRSISELCDEATISQRSLEYAFRNTFGLTPLAFQRLRRLYRANLALRNTDNLQTSVSEIALQNGFYELGRFAQYYQQVFGELPSSTLRSQDYLRESYSFPLLRKGRRVESDIRQLLLS
jgi:AraC family ethanolamine operon transcriptional activator